jgi:hypothetical protein
MYNMLECFQKNRQAIELFSNSAEAKKNNKNKDLPKLSEVEWEQMKKYVILLEPLSTLSAILQARTTTIASIIPSYLLLKKKLSVADTENCDLDIKMARMNMEERLEHLMDGWERNK